MSGYQSAFPSWCEDRKLGFLGELVAESKLPNSMKASFGTMRPKYRLESTSA